MKLSSLGEFGLIKRIERLFPSRASGIITGIGDDTAVFGAHPSRVLLVTTDMLIEGVHFDLGFTDFFSLGWKAAAVNLSDIAAMGGVPRFCLIAIGIPPSLSVEDIDGFYKGFGKILRRYKTGLIGGDTCSSKKEMVISITLIGEIEKERVILRSGARPGDRIYVTGSLGDSAAGLSLLEARRRGSGRGMRRSSLVLKKGVEQRLVSKHLRPVPRLEWGRKLSLAGCASSMIDVSDGLSSDLGHICEASKVGAELICEQIPLSRQLLAFSKSMGSSALEYAMSGGEDYELLFTVPRSKVKKFESLNIPATDIGEITDEKGIFLRDRSGKRRPVAPSGFDHFSR